MICVSQLSDELIFVSDSQDVIAIKEYIAEKAETFDSFFVKLGDGDYTEVYGMYGIVSNMSKEVEKII